MTPGGKTELETAKTPNLDALAKIGVQGGSIPVCPGISPGSGPGHLGLFGYDPLKYLIGRGALEATGIGFALQPGDVAARGNFCTLDAAGKISDRRAGRIPTEESAPLAIRLREVKIPGVRDLRRAGEGASLRRRLPRPGPGRRRQRHRSASRRRAAARRPRPTTPASQKTAEVANQFDRQPRRSCSPARRKPTASRSAASPAGRICRATKKSTASRPPRSPSIRCTRASPSSSAWRSSARPRRSTEQMDVLEQNWSKYDFFFIHFKYTDSTGEDGNFDAKVKRIEELDAAIPRITALKPDVLIVTGDHSTPSYPQEPQLASRADAARQRLLPPRRPRHLRRKHGHPRRPRPVRGQVPDDAGPGQRRPAGQVRGVVSGERPDVAEQAEFTGLIRQASTILRHLLGVRHWIDNTSQRKRSCHRDQPPPSNAPASRSRSRSIRFPVSVQQRLSIRACGANLSAGLDRYASILASRPSGIGQQ